VFLVPTERVSEYIAAYRPVQLRHSRSVAVNDSFPVFNFGDSKGMTFDRVLIYPTKDMLGWVLHRSGDLKPGTRAKCYVALTRAKHSAAFVCDRNLQQLPNGIAVWQ
jgi:DNA helicase-2/ATP-dependent DNA helicase PcrA